MPETSLVIIAKAPVAGRVKTRLAASIGAAGALAVYGQLLARTAAVAQTWPGPVLLARSGTDWTGSGLAHLPQRSQPSGSLGRRIAAALEWGLERSSRAIAIGTDCPGLTAGHLLDLATCLDQVPVAFGPANDGGYWAVAVGDPVVIPCLTEGDLPWSQPELLTLSRHRLAAAGWNCALGSPLADCDDADDLSAAVAAGFLTWPHALERC